MQIIKTNLTKTFYKQYQKIVLKDNNLGKQIFATALSIATLSNANGLNKEPINNGYWSYRVNDEARIITIEQKDSIVLVYVGHHDDAYRFCNSTNPSFSGQNFIGITTLCSEEKTIKNTKYDYLKNHGIDQETINRLNECKSEDEVKSLIKYFAPEYRELILSGGEVDEIIEGYCSDILVINEDFELEKALSLNLPEWCIYLHPNQINVRDFSNDKNLIVKGGPGTGKTVSMVWRYVNLYRKSKDKKPIFLCRSATTALIIKKMIEDIDSSIEPIIDEFPTTISFIEKYFNRYSHIVIDEAQDLTTFTLKTLCKLFFEKKSILPYFSIAYDLNQPVINVKNKKYFKQLESHFDIINLNYCYRCTQQIINRANKYLDSFNDKENLATDLSTQKMDCPLYGNDVLEISLENDDDLENVIDKYIGDNNLDLDEHNWAIVFTGYYNVDKYKFLIEKYNTHIKNGEDSKGNEFFIGIVVHYDNGLEAENITDYKKKKYEPYVATTRFRDICYIINVKKSFYSNENILEAKAFNNEDIEYNSYCCSECKKVFMGVPKHTNKSYGPEGIIIRTKYCPSCWFKHKQMVKKWEPKYKKNKHKN